jgi:hypothetical protein
MPQKRGIYGSTQVERYGQYTAVYGHFTDRITAVISGTEIRPYHNKITVRIRPYTVKMRASYTVPYYCAQDYEKIRSVYGAILSKFTVKIRIAASTDLGIHLGRKRSIIFLMIFLMMFIKVIK